MYSDEAMMRLVLEESELALAQGEVPVGCIIMMGDRMISKAHNRKETGRCATRHAEILAIEEASRILGAWRLQDCKIYVNLEPCLMCLGAILESRIPELIYSLYDYRMGGINGRFGIGEEKIKLTPLCVKSGVLISESKRKIQDFFREKRV